MPWSTPSLLDVRKRNRDYITSRLQRALVPNGVTRVTADAGGGLAHLNLQYLDWLALQLLPDTAETEWLDRQGNIWLINSDGSKGRKAPTPATGFATIAGTPGTIVPFAAILRASSVGGANVGDIYYQTITDTTIGNAATVVPITAIDAGVVGNRAPGDVLSLVTPIFGIPGQAIVVSLLGGTDQESDDELRGRVLERIQKPPMGGDADDYVAWALEYPGVTRAWCSPREMGIGTVTVRFMMDDLRAAQGGFPNAQDVANVQHFVNSQRPVTAIDTFVVAPLREPVSFTLHDLDSNDASTLANINATVTDMIVRKAAPAYSVDGIPRPAQTIYAAWVSEAVMRASGVEEFDLIMSDHIMPSPGHLAVLGNIVLG